MQNTATDTSLAWVSINKQWTRRQCYYMCRWPGSVVINVTCSVCPSSTSENRSKWGSSQNNTVSWTESEQSFSTNSTFSIENTAFCFLVNKVSLHVVAQMNPNKKVIRPLGTKFRRDNSAFNARALIIRIVSERVVGRRKPRRPCIWLLDFLWSIWSNSISFLVSTVFPLYIADFVLIPSCEILAISQKIN